MQRGKIIFIGDFGNFLLIFLCLSVFTFAPTIIMVGLFWEYSSGEFREAEGSFYLLSGIFAMILAMTLGIYQYYWSFKYFFTHMEIEIQSTPQQSANYPKIHSLNIGE